MSKASIGMSVFETNGIHRKKLFEYNTKRSNSDMGIATINLKMGVDIKEHSKKMAERLRY